MEVDIDERLMRVEAQTFAHGCIARIVLARIGHGDPKGLARLREQVCSGIEQIYNRSLTDRGHPFLQLAVAEAEALLAPSRDEAPKRDQ